MVIGGINSEWSEIIRRSSPQYLEAYQEGYEQAKREMKDFLKAMIALHCVTTTVSFPLEARSK